MKQIVLTIFLASFSIFAQAPAVDHHQHLFSPGMAEFQKFPRPLTARDVIELLEDAGIKRAVLLSTALRRQSPGPIRQDERPAQ